MEKIFPLSISVDKDGKEKLCKNDFLDEDLYENLDEGFRIRSVIYHTSRVLEGTYFAYLVGVLTTLERRYSFDGITSGLVLLGNSLSAFILYTLSGNKQVQPIISTGITAVSCFISTTPYFLKYIIPELSSSKCMTDQPLNDCDVENDCRLTVVVSSAGVLFISNFLRGLVRPERFVVEPLYPFSDDESSTMEFSAMAALRIFGPTLGFLLSSFCLKFYEDPFYDPGIDPHNPRWVGAWWMGFFILGVALLFFTLLLALFPRELPARFRSEKKDSSKMDEEKDKQLPKLKDFPKSVKKLLKNPILVCHVISITFQVNGFVGYFVFMPKFMESQYHQSASDASLFSGATGIISMLFGVLIGGYMIKKYKPRPKYLTGYMVLVEIFSVIGLFVSIFLGCPPVQMPGTTVNADETLSLYNECNAECSCTRRVFEPVCGEDGFSTYFSPCFAGCPNTTGLMTSVVTAVATTVTNATVFHDCKCLAGANSTYVTSFVTSGFCSSGCTMFLAYIILLCISKFISSTARVGNTLITFRCVDAEDKSFALGAFGSMLALFAFIPYPLIYGALTDSACLVWEESCSKTGNCWLYDSDKFRYYLHGMSMLLISIGICFDVAVFFLSDRLKNFYGEEEEEEKTSVDRLARWIKEEEEEDIIFTKCPKQDPMLEMDPII